MPPYGRISNADAIIAYNVSKETFYKIGNQNYIPLIAVNCLVEDKLFFQISIDYEKLKREADAYFKDEYYFVSLIPADEAIKKQIEAVFKNIIFVENGTRLLTEFFKGQPVNLLYKDLYSPIGNQVASCIYKALSREPFDVHAYKV